MTQSNATSLKSEDGVIATHSPLMIHQDGPIYQIVLNMPGERNALGPLMIDALSDAVEKATADTRTRVILISAVGHVFSAGGNLSKFEKRLDVQSIEGGRDPLAVANRKYGALLEKLVKASKVTVVVAQGAAVGGGAGLVCAADISVAIAGARFAFPETSIGLVPAQILPFVVARIGAQNARRLVLTGERIDATEAHRIGMIDYLVADQAALASELEALLLRILGCAPRALESAKHMLRQLSGLLGQEKCGLGKFLDGASAEFAQQMRTEAVEGVAASMAKRQPAWAIEPSEQIITRITGVAAVANKT